MSRAKPINIAGQPVGIDLPDWKAPIAPPRESRIGRWCRIEALSVARHGADLCSANGLDTDESAWTYLPYGPFATENSYLTWLERQVLSDDPLFFAIIDQATGKAVGLASYLRIDPRIGVIEVGHLKFSKLLQKSAVATEAMYLMMKAPFDLGYRRYEWKCDCLNQPSRQAAERLGFTFEGIFRQATIYKGRNRDTAWYSIIDREWPAIKAAFEAWLAPDNFDAAGRQRQSLAKLRA